MSARTARTLLAACAVALMAAAPGESMIEQVFRLRTEAAAAAKAGDLETAEARLESARALFPTSPGVMVRLARVQAANGHPEAAVATLKAYADLGLTLDVSADPALKDLETRPDFAAVATRLKTNSEPRGAAQPLATIARRDFIGEGVAFLPDGDVLLSGVAARTVIRIHKGQTRPFLQGGSETGALFGMAVDYDGAIWVAEGWGADLPSGSGPNRTGLLKLSSSGAVLGRYPVPDDGKPHLLGDVVIDEEGVVYASDSVGGIIYQIGLRDTALRVLVASNAIKSPQGMAACAGGLLLADYSSGLFHVDTLSGQVSRIADQDVAALAGLDGLVRDMSRYRRGFRSAAMTADFIATQNGVSPQRVLELHLDIGCRRLQSVDTHIANLPGADDLSLGAVGKDRYVFVGHSQWGAWGGEGKPADDAQPVRLYSFPIL